MNHVLLRPLSTALSPDVLGIANPSFARAPHMPEADGANIKSIKSRFEQEVPTRAAAPATSPGTSAVRPPPAPPPPRRNREAQKSPRPQGPERPPPSITQRQTTRYTDLFTTNSGFFCEQAFIHGYTTRELWQRSRLPESVLEQIWAYVDAGGKGMLTREEFVLGTWLVDGCLAGRKVPTRSANSSRAPRE